MPRKNKDIVQCITCSKNPLPLIQCCMNGHIICNTCLQANPSNCSFCKVSLVYLYPLKTLQAALVLDNNAVVDPAYNP
jgi:hypothetical protein